jgi:hypothetical protein
MMAVLALLAALSAISLSIGSAVKKRLAVGTCMQHMRLLHNALQVYRSESGNAETVVGDIGRLGLPPSLISFSRGTPVIFGQREWFLCPAPKIRETEFPQYKAFFWPNEFAGMELRPRYEEVTAKYKERTRSFLT